MTEDVFAGDEGGHFCPGPQPPRLGGEPLGRETGAQAGGYSGKAALLYFLRLYLYHLVYLLLYSGT